MQLFCIPFAGGTVYSYNGLSKHMDNTIIQVIPLEPPGRGRRSGEELLSSIQDLTFDFLNQLKSKIRGPYALYGHSMGGYLSYLIARHLMTPSGYPHNLLAPQHLFISGCSGPSTNKPKSTLHQLPKNTFLSEVEKFGALPKEIVFHSEMTDYFEPILRADFKAIETDFYQSKDPLNIPITAMAGSKDLKTPPEHILLWQKETTQPLSFKVFDGDHFFIFDHWLEISVIFIKTVLSQYQD